MALNVSTFRKRVQGVFEANLSDKAEIARKLAQAYKEYASAAQGPPVPPGPPVVLKGTEHRLLEMGILTALNARMPGPQFAQAIGNAVTSFWLAPPVQTSSGGVVTAIVPQAGVTKMISTSNIKTVPEAALAFASSLDLMTRTVLVTNPLPIPPGLLF